MREIKFRVWNPNRKKMEKLNLYNIELEWPKLQYTGLKDKNRKEIYEGDIVEYPYGSTKTCKEVKWQDDTSGFYPFADSPENCGCCGMGKNSKFVEVIGNIYENPELLERIK